MLWLPLSKSFLARAHRDRERVSHNGAVSVGENSTEHTMQIVQDCSGSRSICLFRLDKWGTCRVLVGFPGSALEKLITERHIQSYRWSRCRIDKGPGVVPWGIELREESRILINGTIYLGGNEG